MIRFDSPEGRRLRETLTSESAQLSLWLSALMMRNQEWAEWAADQCRGFQVGEDHSMCLRFLAAVLDGDEKRAKGLLILLRSFPAERRTGPYWQIAMATADDLAI